MWFMISASRSLMGTLGQTFFLPHLPRSFWPHGDPQLRGAKLFGPSMGLMCLTFCFVLLPAPFSTHILTPAALFTFPFDFLRVDTNLTLSLLSLFSLRNQTWLYLFMRWWYIESAKKKSMRENRPVASSGILAGASWVFYGKHLDSQKKG